MTFSKVTEYLLEERGEAGFVDHTSILYRDNVSTGRALGVLQGYRDQAAENHSKVGENWPADIELASKR